MRRPPRPEILSSAVDGTDLRVLGNLAPMAPPRYSYTLPGGCDQLSVTLAKSPRWRTRALDPGRRVEVHLGGSVVWRGRMLEPKPSENGWDLTAQGSGTYGSLYMTEWSSGNWAANVPDTAINRAITRGLDWVNPGIGSPTGMFTGQPADDASMSIDDMLNQLTSKGGLTWQVACRPKGNVISVFTLPTTPNRYLIADAPVARTLGGDINKIWLRYQAAPDINQANPAVFNTTTTDDTPSQNKHGITETFEDLTSSGTMTGPNARAVGDYILSRYQRASFADAFTVRHGQLLNLGGTPSELGAYYQAATSPMVCKAALLDYGYGGEVKPGPVQFLVGAYEYDAATDTAAITPYNGVRTDFAGLAEQRISAIHPRHTFVTWRGRKHHRHPVWHFGHRKRHH